MIRFLEGHDVRELEAVEADTTVLAWLREHRQRTGTKEGCASGDCGACTVVVASLEEDKSGGGTALRYTPMNACIAPLGSLHGKQLITVEDLREGDTLHPVQQAMVDCHGSQCGFCTPGFVMSLFALYKNRAGTDMPRAEVLEALGGNLCRCTGYRPIVDAAFQALASDDGDQFQRLAEHTTASLAEIAGSDGDTRALHTNSGAFFRPHSADEVAQLLSDHPDARLLAGGTDLLLEVTQQLRPLSKLIAIGAAQDLHRIDITSEQISLGAAVTHRDATPVLTGEYPELAELIERFGSLQIRTQGTVVGNIANASPIGDWPPVLLALNATLTLSSAGGERSVAMDDFFLDYRKTALAQGEFIHSVHIPRRRDDVLLRAYKISKRYEDDISSVCAVFALQMDSDRVASVRVALGGMAATPQRARACENALLDQRLASLDVSAAADSLAGEFEPISDARASSEYRRQVTANLLLRLQREQRGEMATRAHAVHYHSGTGDSHG